MADGIGTRKEQTLHAQLKRSYAGPDGAVEVPVGSYVCDAVAPSGEIVEVQRKNFGAVATKLRALAAAGPTLLVHPVAAVRTIELVDETGATLRRRKSPKKGTAWELFDSLVSAPTLPLAGGLRIEVLLVAETERRVADGKGSWRRGGISVADRRLDAVLGSVLLSGPEDYAALLPPELPHPFTAKDLATAAGLRIALARKAVYVLSRMGVLRDAGKDGRAKLYGRIVPERLWETQ